MHFAAALAPADVEGAPSEGSARSAARIGQKIEAEADVTVQDNNGKGLREKMNPKLLEALGPSLDAAEAKAKGEL